MPTVPEVEAPEDQASQEDLFPIDEDYDPESAAALAGLLEEFEADGREELATFEVETGIDVASNALNLEGVFDMGSATMQQLFNTLNVDEIQHFEHEVVDDEEDYTGPEFDPLKLLNEEASRSPTSPT